MKRDERRPSGPRKPGPKQVAQKLRGRNRRLAFVRVGFMLALAFLLGRIGWIMYHDGERFEIYAVRQTIVRQQANAERIIEPMRGGILDRNRQPLVENDVVYTIALDMLVLQERISRNQSLPERTLQNLQEALSIPASNWLYYPLKEQMLQVLHQALDIPMSTLRGYWNRDGTLVRNTNWQIIARQVPPNIALPLGNLPTVHLERDFVRRHPDPFMAPQVLGFGRGDSAWGLERQYRHEIEGERGRVFRAFLSGTEAVDETIPARDGHWLVTTLDSGIQRIAQQAVDSAAETFQPQFAGMVIMQPHTGEILAMAQYPTFPLDVPDDISRFTNADSDFFEGWDELSQEQQLYRLFPIWGNFFLGRSFEPGSIFKSFTMAAALEEGIINPDVDAFFCAGVRQVLDTPLTCMSHHGSQNLIEALKFSCNIAFIDIAQSMGRNVFYRYRNDFGFGEQTGIDLPGEEAVSGPGVMYTLARLNPVELSTSSFGQGFNATPIQAINGFAALINGGYLMRPFVVAQVIDGQGQVVRENHPTVMRKVISQETSDFMREAMQAVVSPQGTGRRGVIEGHNIGGKTGTGQQGAERDWIVSSFLGYFPVENPQFLAMAIVYHPSEETTAGASAVPMVREAFEGIIHYRQIPPAGAEQELGVLMQVGGDLMMDFSGQQLRDVVRSLNNLNMDYRIVGSGSIVTSHIPTPGMPRPRHQPVVLYLHNDISNTDELTFVPNVLGLSEARAVELIAEAGLAPLIVAGEPLPQDANLSEEEMMEQWHVYRQFPDPELHIQRGTQVRLRTRAP